MGLRREFAGIMPVAARVDENPSERRVLFGAHRFDLESGRLWFAATEVRLTPKAAAVLKMLVQHAGKPVTKEELFASVWNGTVVTDDALTSCIQELRKALEDDAKQPRFIETRHRRGYRFIAPLTEAATEEAADLRLVRSHLSAIAVLPFADMSSARDQDYLCEGLAEELINALTRIDGLRVTARTASFQFRNPGADVRVIGRHLGVGTLLEGSVRRAGDRLRVTVQLIETETGFHRWSQRFDRTLEDVLAIQDEIAEHVATSLRGSVLSRIERPSNVRPQTVAAAYEYYLRGRQHVHRMTQSDLEASGELFERAIAEDTHYGPAWSCLTAVHCTLYEWFGAKKEDLEKAERTSRRALEVAPGLAEAHMARGFVLSLSGQYDEAAGEFQQAISLNPNLFEAYYYFARASFANGEVERSAELFRKATEVRQEDFQSAILLGQSLRMLGRMEESRAAVREGIRRAETMLVLNANDCRALSLGSAALFHDDQIERALEWSNRAVELYPEDMSALINAACLHSKLGQKEEAIGFLERVFARGWGKRDWVEHDPDYDILRDDPRFQRLLSKLK